MPSIQGNMISVFFKSLAFYWRHYGPSLFVSSLILGVFLATVLSRQWTRIVTARAGRGAGAV
jgi:hypothetical protein